MEIGQLPRQTIVTKYPQMDIELDQIEISQ